MLGAEDKKGFAEPCQREHRSDSHHPPIGGVESPEIIPSNRVCPYLGLTAHRLSDPENQERHGHQPRDDGDPKDCLKVIDLEEHQPNGNQWANERAGGIQRLPQAERCASEMWRRDVRHQRIARRPSHPFPYPIQ